MTTRRDLILGLSLTPFALAARNIHAAEQAEAKPQFLFVQSAEGMRYADGVLTLKGVNPITVLFSDRPERLAGHMATDDFVPFWSEGGEGGESFESEPPNADIAVLEAGNTDNVVVTLHDPKLEGDDLSYRVDILEGQLPANGGAVSLFIDVIGRPLTPVSFAGRRRRMWQRRAFEPTTLTARIMCHQHDEDQRNTQNELRVIRKSTAAFRPPAPDSGHHRLGNCSSGNTRSHRHPRLTERDDNHRRQAIAGA